VPSTRLFPHATLLLLSWGVLAFGAEYAWAYAPLMVFSVAVGLLGFTAPRPEPQAPTPKLLLLALGLVIAAVVIQLIPLSKPIIASLSPARDVVNYEDLYAKETARQIEPATPVEAGRDTPLSIEPSRTWLGLAFLAAFSFLLVGSVRGLNAVGAVGIARGIVVLGVIAAFLQIFQKASGSPVMYGLFMPRQAGMFSAPFVNRNHTAGWLVMAMALSMGHLAGCVARGMRGVRPQWRDRILWLSSSDASETLLTAFAVAVMAIAIVLTQSRSGALCLILATMLFLWWAVRRQASTSRRLLMSTHVLFVLAAAAIMGGADAVMRRFASTIPDEPGGRIAVWNDTLPIISDFAFTGTGLNTYGIAMLHYQTIENGLRYIEAHNDYLQIAAEGGLLLGAPILILLGVVIREVRRRFREGADDTRTYWLRAGAVTALVAIAFQSLFDFTLQMPGAAALFVALAAIALHHPRPRSSRPAGGALGG
jgi:O-antigen ligase